MPFEIHRAADLGDLAQVRALLKDDPDRVLSADPDGMLPLHNAAAMGHKNVVELLLTEGAGAGGTGLFFQVNAKDSWGRTPMHYAAYNGHTAVAELLLGRGADVNAVDQYRMTPLHKAKQGGYNKEIEELLRQHGGHE